jgi:hypothetical protein
MEKGERKPPKARAHRVFAFRLSPLSLALFDLHRSARIHS